MSQFDPKGMSQAYERIANEAERYALEAKSKIVRTGSYRELPKKRIDIRQAATPW